MSANKVFRLGVDIGQRVDHSAICAVEEVGDKVITRLLMKYPLGTGYPLVVQTVSELYKSIQSQGDVWSFAVDATGVGSTPTAMLQEALPEARVEAFIFTNKSKRELVGKVKVLHSFGRLKFARRKGDELYNQTLYELINEMKHLQAKVLREDASNPELEVFKTGAHDDLFTALALAVKDVSLSGMNLPTAEFVKDNTWVQTPLNEPAPEAPVVLF